MKKIIILAIAILINSTAIFAQTKAGRVDTTKHATYYSCPNHPDSVKHQPGKCSICGMELNLSKKRRNECRYQEKLFLSCASGNIK